MCCVLDIIIVGNGKMGFSLADQLASEDHSITIVDTHEAALRRASDTLDVMLSLIHIRVTMSATELHPLLIGILQL